MKTAAVLFLFICFLAGGCQNPEPGKNKNPEITIDSQVLDLQKDGYDLLKSSCFACHNPASASHDSMLAPPLAGIKMRYLRQYDRREDFLVAMSRFVANPSEETALMKGPVRRFGLMPNPQLNEKDIDVIVSYIYDNKLEEPAWFADHYAEMHGN